MIRQFRIPEDVVRAARVNLHILISLCTNHFSDCIEHLPDDLAVNTGLFLNIGNQAEVYIPKSQAVKAGIQEKVQLQYLFLGNVFIQVDNMILHDIPVNHDYVEKLSWRKT